MTEKKSPGSPTAEISELGRRNRTIDGQPDREDDRGDTVRSRDPRIDRLEQAIVRIEAEIHEQQTAPTMDDVRAELARLVGRLDALEALGASRPRVSQEGTGRVRPSAADVGLHRLATLVHRRRTAAGRRRGVMAGVGAMLDLHGRSGG